MKRRYRYDEATKELVEIDRDYTGSAPKPAVATEQLIFGGLGKATDGTPIDSRTKHRAYMKANGLALNGDFKETFAKAKEEREKRFAGDWGDRDRREQREAIGKITYELEQRKRRR